MKCEHRPTTFYNRPIVHSLYVSSTTSPVSGVSGVSSLFLHSTLVSTSSSTPLGSMAQQFGMAFIHRLRFVVFCCSHCSPSGFHVPELGKPFLYVFSLFLDEHASFSFLPLHATCRNRHIVHGQMEHFASGIALDPICVTHGGIVCIVNAMQSSGFIVGRTLYCKHTA